MRKFEISNQPFCSFNRRRLMIRKEIEKYIYSLGFDDDFTRFIILDQIRISIIYIYIFL